jgi:hypothetical protein
MQTKAFMEEAAGIAKSPDPQQPVRVVIAYDDLVAGKRAMRVLGDIARALGDEIRFEPMPWSFDLLADVDWREVAASEAVNAHILIIASSSTRPLPSEVGRWTEAAIQRKRGTAAAVVALFGPEENPDHFGSPRLEFIQKAAREAGLDFFAPSSRHDLEEGLTGIHQRADMITPVMAGILQQAAGFDSAQTEVRP